MMRVLILASLIGIASSASQGAVIFQETFDNVAGLLSGGGWVNTNLSNPIGTESWAQGNTSNFTAQDGTNGYVGVGILSAGAVPAVISNWLLTPVLTLQDGDVVSFLTRTVPNPIFADRLEVRWSGNGSSTDVGTTDSSVGDFTSLLLVINEALSVAGYPTDWTSFSITISGLGTPVRGRLAFRYTIPDIALQGDYIGVDTLSVTRADAEIPEPSTLWTFAAGAAILAGLRLRRS